jgi:hypothetical protein
VKWAVKVGEKEPEVLNKTGEELTLKIDKNWVGETIVVMPHINKYTDIVSVRTRVGSQSTLIEKRILIAKVIGAEKAYTRQRVRYEAIYNKKESEFSSEDMSKTIKWAIKVNDGERILLGNKDITRLDDKGEEIILGIKEEWVGSIVVMACIEGFNDRVCQKTEIGQDSEIEKDNDGRSILIIYNTAITIFKLGDNQELYTELNKVGYTKEAPYAYKEGMKNLKNKYFVEALYTIFQKTYLDRDKLEYGFTGKEGQKEFNYIKGYINDRGVKSVDLKYLEDCEYGAHSHPSKSALSPTDLEHSERGKRYSYVITKIGDIYFTTPALAKIGQNTGEIIYGQVYLGSIEDLRGKRR